MTAEMIKRKRSGRMDERLQTPFDRWGPIKKYLDKKEFYMSDRNRNRMNISKYAHTDKLKKEPLEKSSRNKWETI